MAKQKCQNSCAIPKVCLFDCYVSQSVLFLSCFAVECGTQSITQKRIERYLTSAEHSEKRTVYLRLADLIELLLRLWKTKTVTALLHKSEFPDCLRQCFALLTSEWRTKQLKFEGFSSGTSEKSKKRPERFLDSELHDFARRFGVLLDAQGTLLSFIRDPKGLARLAFPPRDFTLSGVPASTN